METLHTNHYDKESSRTYQFSCDLKLVFYDNSHDDSLAMRVGKDCKNLKDAMNEIIRIKEKYELDNA